MRHRAALPAQRTRCFLRQEALKRSHRRCDLIRMIPDNESTVPPAHAVEEAEPAGERLLNPPRS